MTQIHFGRLLSSTIDSIKVKGEGMNSFLKDYKATGELIEKDGFYRVTFQSTTDSRRNVQITFRENPKTGRYDRSFISYSTETPSDKVIDAFEKELEEDARDLVT